MMDKSAATVRVHTRASDNNEPEALVSTPLAVEWACKWIPSVLEL